YFGSGAPGCTPVVPAPAAHVNGSGGGPTTEVIEGGMTSVNVPARTTTVVGSEAPRRVVVSEPDNRPRSSWRPRTDPRPAVATRVEGGVQTTSDPTTVR